MNKKEVALKIEEIAEITHLKELIIKDLTGKGICADRELFLRLGNNIALLISNYPGMAEEELETYIEWTAEKLRLALGVFSNGHSFNKFTGTQWECLKDNIKHKLEEINRDLLKYSTKQDPLAGKISYEKMLAAIFEKDSNI